MLGFSSSEKLSFTSSESSLELSSNSEFSDSATRAGSSESGTMDPMLAIV